MDSLIVCVLGGLVSVLDKPGSVCAQACSDVGCVCNAEDKLFSEVIRCGLYLAFCQQEETLPCLSASEIIDLIC